MERMRRVVVTGLGMVSPLACGVEATWRRLLASESAASRVENFDVSDLACQIAAQVPRDGAPDGFKVLPNSITITVVPENPCAGIAALGAGLA